MSPTPELSVTVLDEGRLGSLFIPADCDRACVSPSLISALALQARVRVTPEVQAAIAAACQDFARQPRAVSVDIARATEPAHGSAGAWVWQPEFDPNAKPSEGPASGSVDHHASHLRTVVCDAHLATCSPPEDGADSATVTGEVLPASRGKAALLRIGKGLEVRQGGRVHATLSGVLSIAAGVVSVVQVLRLPGSVDFSTGNVDFQGDVEVADSVRDGFKVRATGSLTIRGDVEGAEIACAGNLTCQRGIASSKRARVVVGGATDIGFARNISAILRGDFHFRGELEHCDITVGGRCAGEAGRAIGGILVLTGPAHIGTLGSPDWTPTLVCVGELPLIAMDLRRLTAEAARIQKTLAGKDDEARLLTMGGPSKGAGAREPLTELQFESVLSFDDRNARHSVGCSSWVINDLNSMFMTAGHCGTSGGHVMQFKVPLSTASGGLVNPPPEHQYTVEATSVQGVNGGIGNDWGYFGVANSNTGFTPFQSYGLRHVRGNAGAPSGHTIRITGYGTDSSPVSPTWNQVQKTHTGSYTALVGTNVQYAVDTTGGNSGSCVLNLTPCSSPSRVLP